MSSVCHNYQWIEIVASAVILTGIDMQVSPNLIVFCQCPHNK